MAIHQRRFHILLPLNHHTAAEQQQFVTRLLINRQPEAALRLHRKFKGFTGSETRVDRVNLHDRFPKNKAAQRLLAVARGDRPACGSGWMIRGAWRDGLS